MFEYKNGISMMYEYKSGEINMKMLLRLAVASVFLGIFGTSSLETSAEPAKVIYRVTESDGPGREASNLSYRLDNFDKPQQFQGGTVSFLSNDASERQQLCGIFKSADGSLLVIDGGVPENADKLVSAISAAGGSVDAWLITHPQDDHVGALYEILHNKSTGIEIKNIYYNFHDFSWYSKVAPDEQGMVWNLMEEFENIRASGSPTVLHSEIKKGDVIDVSENISVRVLNDPLKIEDSAYSVNDSGIMYDISFEGKNFFVPGDMGPDGGEELLRAGVLEGLNADYCVMSHHGQNGLKDNFYKKLSPKACIWSCPAWIYDAQFGNSDGLKTYETKQWIKQMNITDNYCTYNGDINLK